MAPNLWQSHNSENPNDSAQSGQQKKRDMPTRQCGEVEAYWYTCHLGNGKGGHHGSHRRSSARIWDQIADHRQTDAADDATEKSGQGAGEYQCVVGWCEGAKQSANSKTGVDHQQRGLPIESIEKECRTKSGDSCCSGIC